MGETPEWTGNGRKGFVTALKLFFEFFSGLRACFLEFLEDFEGFPGSSKPPATFQQHFCVPCTTLRERATPVQPPCNHRFVQPLCHLVQPPCNLLCKHRAGCKSFRSVFGFFGNEMAAKHLRASKMLEILWFGCFPRAGVGIKRTAQTVTFHRLLVKSSKSEFDSGKANAAVLPPGCGHFYVGEYAPTALARREKGPALTLACSCAHLDRCPRASKVSTAKIPKLM